MPFILASGISLSVFMGAIGILCNVGKGKKNGEEFGKSKLDFIMFKKKNKVDKI